MKTSNVAAKCSAALTVLGLAIGAMAHGAPAGTVEAIWHQQSLDFYFSSAHGSYTCRGIKVKLAAILESVGVQDSLQVSCIGNAATSNLQLRLQTLHAIEATPANVAAATQHDGTRRLLAHLRNEALPSATDLPRFNASWQRIDLHRQRKLRLQPGDCELLQQVRKQLFPKLAVEVVQDGLHCHAGSATRLGHPLRVLALLPQKRSPGTAPQTGQP